MCILNQMLKNVAFILTILTWFARVNGEQGWKSQEGPWVDRRESVASGSQSWNNKYGSPTPYGFEKPSGSGCVRCTVLQNSPPSGPTGPPITIGGSNYNYGKGGGSANYNYGGGISSGYNHGGSSSGYNYGGGSSVYNYGGSGTPIQIGDNYPSVYRGNGYDNFSPEWKLREASKQKGSGSFSHNQATGGNWNDKSSSVGMWSGSIRPIEPTWGNSGVSGPPIYTPSNIGGSWKDEKIPSVGWMNREVPPLKVDQTYRVSSIDGGNKAYNWMQGTSAWNKNKPTSFPTGQYPGGGYQVYESERNRVSEQAINVQNNLRPFDASSSQPGFSGWNKPPGGHAQAGQDTSGVQNWSGGQRPTSNWEYGRPIELHPQNTYPTTQTGVNNPSNTGSSQWDSRRPTWNIRDPSYGSESKDPWSSQNVNWNKVSSSSLSVSNVYGPETANTQRGSSWGSKENGYSGQFSSWSLNSPSNQHYPSFATKDPSYDGGKRRPGGCLEIGCSESNTHTSGAQYWDSQRPESWEIKKNSNIPYSPQSWRPSNDRQDTYYQNKYRPSSIQNGYQSSSHHGYQTPSSNFPPPRDENSVHPSYGNDGYQSHVFTPLNIPTTGEVYHPHSSYDCSSQQSSRCQPTHDRPNSSGYPAYPSGPGASGYPQKDQDGITGASNYSPNGENVPGANIYSGSQNFNQDPPRHYNGHSGVGATLDFPGLNAYGHDSNSQGSFKHNCNNKTESSTEHDQHTQSSTSVPTSTESSS